MASLALFALGAAIGPGLFGVAASATIIGGLTAGALFGAIGGAIGGLIDSTFLFPALFGSPSQSIQGPQIEDYGLQTVSEGTAIRECFGPLNRFPGQVLWRSPFDITTITNTTGGGGKGGGGGSVTSTTYEARVDIAVGLCSGQISAVKKIWADDKVIYEAGIVDKRVEDITLYNGSTTQSKSSLITAREGSDDTPAFRDLAYVTIKQMLITDWGNRIPRFTFLVEENHDRSVASVIDDICEQAGMTSGEYDTVAVRDCLLGYNVGTVTNAARKIEPLMLAYNLTSKYQDGTLYFLPKDSVDQFTIPAGDLAASVGEEGVEYPFLVADKSSVNIPNSVVVDYIDTTNDFQRGSWIERSAISDNPEITKIDLPLTLTPSDVVGITRRLLHAAEIERFKTSLSLSPVQLRAEVTDVVTVPDLDGDTDTVRITRIDRGVNFLLRVEGLSTNLSALEIDSDDGQDGDTQADPYVPPDLIPAIFDIPPLRESDAYEPGIYWGGQPDFSGATWAGAACVTSLDDSNFNIVGYVGNEMIIGTLTTALAAGPDGVWDETNSFTVSVARGTLSSASDIDVQDGKENLAILVDSNGNTEIIGFTTVVDNGDGTYTLSRLARGRRGLPSRAFSVDDTLYLVSGDRIGYSSYVSGLLNVTQFHRMVALGGSVADEDTVAKTLAGNNVRCFAPTHITGSRDASNNLSVNWTRRSRIPSDVFSPISGILEEPEEKYEIDVYYSSTLTAGSPYTVVGESNWEYSAAEQTADGVTLGATVDIRIHQIGQYTGRGYEGQADL